MPNRFTPQEKKKAKTKLIDYILDIRDDIDPTPEQYQDEANSTGDTIIVMPNGFGKITQPITPKAIYRPQK